MQWKNSSTQYGPVSRSLHWLMAVLLVASYVLIELHELSGRTPLGAAYERWHSMVGMSIGLLVLLRFGLRLVQVTPRIEPPLSRPQAVAAHAMHGALYLFMLAMPLIGWALFSAEGHPVRLMGLTFPPLLETNRDLASVLKEVHEFIANLGYVLVGVHVIAALYHHYLQRDDTLIRMVGRR